MEKFVFGESASNSLVGVIRQAILSGRFTPGELISTSALAEELGVSRTPVREALLQLAQAGMVQFEKNRGARVVGTSIPDLVGVFQVRLLLEVPLIARAARAATESELAQVEHIHAEMLSAAERADYEAFLSADRDFHHALMRIAGSPRAVSIVRDLRNVVLTRGVGTVPHSRSTRDIIREHNAILSAVRASHPSAAADAMRRHILNTAHLLINQESKGSEEYSRDWVAQRLDGARKVESG